MTGAEEIPGITRAFLCGPKHDRTLVIVAHCHGSWQVLSMSSSIGLVGHGCNADEDDAIIEVGQIVARANAQASDKGTPS